MQLDALAIGAHPDDVELGIGGILHKLGQRGFRVGILDLTRAESATRGTPEERAIEAAEAARCLGVVLRRNADLPDGFVQNNREQRLAVIRILRELRPRVLFAPMSPDRHADHMAAHELCRDAHFLAGVGGIDTEQPSHRAERLFFYHGYFVPEQMPPLVVDISDHFEDKRRAIEAYQSQFYNPHYAGAQTMVSSEAFWRDIETRAAFWGQRAGFRYGEPLYMAPPLGLDLPPGF